MSAVVLFPFRFMSYSIANVVCQIGAPFSTDIIQASTRVNYGQNLGIIHGLETMVCMAIEGAMSIQGGNWQIFHNFINASGADIRLNTAVTELKRHKGKYVVLTSPNHTLSMEDTFDAVVLAAPLQFSGIKLKKGTVKHVPDEIPYVRLHVTLFTSALRISRTHFHLKEGAEVPTTVLTTLSPDEDPSNRENIVGKSGFFSISTLRSIINPKTSEKEYLYKIFSPEKITEEFLASLFGITCKPTFSLKPLRSG
jgi:prenylcysteine oxidase / farnesylcysteine lyase